MEKETLSNVIHIFSYSSIIYWLCQDRITPQPPKLIQGFWEDPWHRVCWKIGKVQVCLSVILNYWTSPNLPPPFLLLFFFYSAFTQLEVTIVMLSLQALQFNEDRAAVLIGCLKWLLFFFSWNVFLLRFFFFLVWRTVKMLRTITPFNIIVDSHLSLRQKDCPVWW